MSTQSTLIKDIEHVLRKNDMMKFEEKLKEVQASLSDEGLEGWLLFDFHNSNPLAYTFLEIPLGKTPTRRFFYWIPRKGEPIKIVPLIEPYTCDHLPGIKWSYRGWQELEGMLFSLVLNKKRVAMEYSPNNALPTVSKVDGGTVDLIRRAGAEVVSSANILQRYTSVWAPEQVKSHFFASKVLENVVERAWEFIERSLLIHAPVDEYQVQQFMLQAIHEGGCDTVDRPTCAVNAHSADPHYHPTPAQTSPIKIGDFVLLDLWCKQNVPQAVYADITRVGVAARQATQKQRQIFNIVKEARDQTTLFIKEHYENQRPLQGWQVDQFCRDLIQETGYGEFFIHRTGHNIGEEVHGPGANMDNLETHDYRQLLPGTCFSIEPGIYLPQEFGVRLEYDVYLDPSMQMHVTGGIQEELVCLQVG